MSCSYQHLKVMEVTDPNKENIKTKKVQDEQTSSENSVKKVIKNVAATDRYSRKGSRLQQTSNAATPRTRS